MRKRDRLIAVKMFMRGMGIDCIVRRFYGRSDNNSSGSKIENEIEKAIRNALNQAVADGGKVGK